MFHGDRYSTVDTVSCRATQDTVTNPDTGVAKLVGIFDDETGLPYKSGERSLIAVDSTGTLVDADPLTNGTIVLATTTTDTTSAADAANGIGVGCPDPVNSEPKSVNARLKAALARSASKPR